MSGKKVKNRRTTITGQPLWMVVFIPSGVVKRVVKGSWQEKTHREFPEDTTRIQVSTKSHS